MIENIFAGSVWEVEYLGNALWEYVAFLSILLSLAFFVFLVKHFLFRRLSSRIKEKEIFNLFLDIVDKIRSPYYVFVSFYIALGVIEIPELLSRLFWIILVLWTVYRVVIVGYQFIDFFLDGYLKKQAESGNTAMIRAAGNIAKGILWLFAGLVVLSFLGVNVTGIVAGMGLGGVAVAFALQGILSDLFSSFSIYFDKPFVEGDFINVGDKWGTVEKIGIKSTRIRSIGGEEIVISNRDLTTAQVHNYRNMNRRRAEFAIGVVYETPIKKMEKIPQIIREIVEKEEIATFDRIHFRNFGDFSLDYILVYYIETRDYTIFLDTNQRVLLNIKRAFEKEGIEFAYPTKTIHLVK